MEMKVSKVTSLPEHGQISCTRCFEGEAVWNVTQRETSDGWHVVNNPMSWGAQTPRFLVLGVSKGTTQCDALNTKPHDQVPFDGFRSKLTDALRALGLFSVDEVLDSKIRVDENDWAFGSMVRCALGLINPEAGNISRSGTVVQRLAHMDDDTNWLSRCSTVFLSQLPERLKICVLLSNDDKYIEACRRAITRLRPETRPINSVAYSDGQITWVHIVHVGGPGKNHINNWFEGQGKQGRKRTEAQSAVSQALGHPVLANPEAKRVEAPKPQQMPKTNDGAAKKRAANGLRRKEPKNPMRDAIIARIHARDDIRTHPDQERVRQTSQKISAFVSDRGAAFAVDMTCASKQPIWLLDHLAQRSALDSVGVAYDLYPPDHGRNSNLHKLTGFKHGALIRAFPETTKEAINVIDLLCSGAK